MRAKESADVSCNLHRPPSVCIQNGIDAGDSRY
jgi:hypothetical protein